jgi:hypothetical protein
MFNSIFGILRAKKKAKNEDKSDGIAGFIPAFEDINEFKSQHNLTCPARTLSELIKYLDSRSNQKWYVFKSARKKAHPINVGVYEEFPILDTAVDWLETYGGGKYFVKPLTLGKCKLGYYEFEGEDKEPEEEEETVRSKKLRLKYKPRDFREALLLQRLEEGDEQLIQKVTDAELSRQGIVSNDGACSIQPQGVDIKEHFDEITELKEEIHKKDMQYMEEIRKKDMQRLEERFKKGEKSSGWDAFMRMLETDTGKELGREALDTIKEIFKTAGSSGKEEAEVEKFEDFNSKALPPSKEYANKVKPRRDFTPLKMMCKFIENDGDPSAYLEAMSVSHPEHPFCQTLITCEAADQFLSKLKSLEQKLPILFGDKGKAWLEELFRIIKEFKKGEVQHEPGTETESAADSSAAPESDADALSEH